MVTSHAIRRALRRLHSSRDIDPIPGELRGWSYDTPPVRPRAYLGLGVSEVAYGAACGWRRMGLRGRGEKTGRTQVMEAGLILHEAIHRASRDLRTALARGEKPWDAAERLLASAYKRLPREWPGWALSLYKMMITLWAGESAGYTVYYGGEGLGSLPWLTEYRVDGSPLGLSKSLRVDALGEAGVVVEIKLGRPSWWHKLSLAGYAMAMESFIEAPIDYGIAVTVASLDQPRIHLEPVYISPDLREDFLRARDEAIEVLLSEVEPPESRCNGGEQP